MLMGTPDYMAPEQWRGLKIDGKADTYALGCILFEALVGRVPFSAPEMPALAFLHCFEPPQSLIALDPQLPAELCELCGRMLEKDPTQRPTMSEVADGLGRALGLPLGTGSHAVVGPAAPLSEQAKAALDTEARTMSGQRLDSDNLDAALAEPTPAAPAPAVPPVTPAGVVSVAVQGVETAPIQTPPTAPKKEVAGPEAAPSQTPPAGPKKTVSFTAPTIRPVSQSSRWVLLVLLLGIVSGGATWAVLHDWHPRAAPLRPDLGATADRVTVAPPDLAAPPDLSRPPDLAEPPRERPRSHCTAHPANASCILTPMRPRQREALDLALKENIGVHLCAGERLVITGLLGHLDVQAPPTLLKRQSLSMFLYALKGLPLDVGAFPGKVEIQCAR